MQLCACKQPNNTRIRSESNLHTQPHHEIGSRLWEVEVLVNARSSCNIAPSVAIVAVPHIEDVVDLNAQLDFTKAPFRNRITHHGVGRRIGSHLAVV